MTCLPGKYEETIRQARQKVSLEGLGISGVKIRRAITEALIFEIPGKDSHELADKLALSLRQALAGKDGVHVQRPVKMAELRLRGLDDSITTLEVLEAVARTGGCEVEEIHLGEIKKTPGGMGVIWIRCPLKAANQIMQTAQMRIGWALTRAELLEAKLAPSNVINAWRARARAVPK